MPTNDPIALSKDPLKLLADLVAEVGYNGLFRALRMRQVSKTLAEGLVERIKGVVEPYVAADKADNDRWHQASKANQEEKIHPAIQKAVEVLNDGLERADAVAELDSRGAGTHRDKDGLISFHDVCINPLLVPKTRAEVRIGRRVRHQIFGDGTVVDTPGGKFKKLSDVTINFDLHGTKSLMWNFCQGKLNMLPALTRKQKRALELAKHKAQLADIKKSGGRK